ncbi:MAG: Gfo/Idh/MocA family oxidoreductase [Bacteroidota bacterium]|nr:Gfo/Idh/MocA family oxidoreductase [Bacteroidota bacterium]
MNTEIKEKRKKGFLNIVAKPKIGFLGVGWIGRNRMESIAKSGLVEIMGIADPSRELVQKAKELAPRAVGFSNLKEMLSLELDGIVIATPSAMHAEQAIIALENKLAVFCQKPLGRNAKETTMVIQAARTANRLLGVDLSYRYLKGMQRIKSILDNGDLGKIFAANLVFHNAYGPDKPWFYDPRLSGGGCVIDLGIHLIDLLLWLFKNPRVDTVSSRLFSQGNILIDHNEAVEDFASSRIDLSNGTSVNMTCSWKISAGCNAVIEASFYGTHGAVSVKNINGSFYDFKAERYNGTAVEVLSEPPDDWGPRAALRWSEMLVKNNGFNEEISDLANVASVLDRIYLNDEEIHENT